MRTNSLRSLADLPEKRESWLRRVEYSCQTAVRPSMRMEPGSSPTGSKRGALFTSTTKQTFMRKLNQISLVFLVFASFSSPGSAQITNIPPPIPATKLEAFDTNTEVV